MRILWICNIMLPIIAEHLHREASNKEGWLSGLLDGMLERQGESGLVLGVAFPVEQEMGEYREEILLDKTDPEGEGAGNLRGSGYVGKLTAYGFQENAGSAEQYEPSLELRMKAIYEDFKPDVVHCFGTEYGHALAAAKICGKRERFLVSLQGLCAVCAQAYMADLPEKVQRDVTFRDWLRRDSIRQQQAKFVQRGEREKEVIGLAANVAGRTDFDKYYVTLWNPKAKYYALNETLREPFYRGEWPGEGYEPHTIFISQGDYPLKGLHYMLRALPLIREKYPDVRAAVAGSNLTAYKSLRDKMKLSAYGKYLRRLIRENGLEEAVTFLGRLTAEQMKEQYLHSGVYVCCSTMENSPNSLGEAMLLGMPCVAADVGGIPSMLADGKEGILYRGFRSGEIRFYGRDGADGAALSDNGSAGGLSGDDVSDGGSADGGLSGDGASASGAGEEGRIAARLAEAVLDIFDHEERSRLYGQRARERARATHHRENNYQSLMAVYREIAECGGGREA